MAKSRTRVKTTKTTKTTKVATAPRAMRSSSARPASREVAEVEIVEASDTSTWEAGVAIATCIALVAALLVLDSHNGSHLGRGVIF